MSAKDKPVKLIVDRKEVQEQYDSMRVVIPSGKPKPFPKWSGKEHPDFGYDIDMLVRYMLETEKAKREFVAWLQSDGKSLREWLEENAEIWNAGKYKESSEFGGIILVPLKKVLEALGDK